MTCPYCNSKETISIIYLYRYNGKNTFNKKSNEEVKYSEEQENQKYKKELNKLEYENKTLKQENRSLIYR